MARRKVTEDRGAISPVTLKDGRTRYRLVMDVGPKDGPRRQVCSTWDTPEEAAAERRRILTEIGTDTYVRRQGVTVADYLDAWLDGLHDLKVTTRKGYRWNLLPVVREYGHKPLQALTKADLDRLVRQRLDVDGVTPRTVTLTLVVLGSALKAAEAQGVVTRNVAALVRLPKAEGEETGPKGVGQAWDAEQARTFLRQVEGERFAAAFRLSLYGLRRGEVCGLTWGAVDLDGGTVTVSATRVVAGGEVVTTTTKNRRARVVPVGPEVVADLRRLKARQREEALALGIPFGAGSLVLVNAAGEPIRPETYADLIRGHAKAAGLPRIRPHDLRHTAASLLLSVPGASLTTVAAILGHDPLVLASVYAHPYDTAKAEAVAGLSSLYAV